MPPAAVPADSAALQATATEAYRRSPYPAVIHPLTHPDRLASIARLAGMEPPDIRTARVLDIGTGSGLNILSIAQTLPHATCVGIDIEPDALARGREWGKAAGLANVRLEVADLTDGLSGIEGSFDYIIAHGVYAWVPEPVAEALLALIGARLSPNGVAFVSFNALPGCYSRMPLRDAMLRAAAGATTDEERIERARRMLARMAKERPGDGPLETGFRAAAKTKLEQNPAILVHDEMGPVYRPRHLADVLERARAHSLKYLSDASFELTLEALVADSDIAEADLQDFVEYRACANDDAAFRQFRRLLLVRDTAAPKRRIDLALICELFASRSGDELEPGAFEGDLQNVRVEHGPLTEALRRLADAYPRRVRVGDLGLDDADLPSLLGLFDCGVINFHPIAEFAAAEPGDKPVTSPLARTMQVEGQAHIPNLDHRFATLSDPLAGALQALDGTTDAAALEEQVEGLEASGARVFAGFAKAALLLR